MPVTAYKFPAYRLHYSLVISQRYTKATQRAAKNNKSLCVTLCMLCGPLCNKSCFADANTGIRGRKYIRVYQYLAVIDEQYTHTPVAFKNGVQYNNATENQGSARVLYFAYLHKLSKEESLSLFAEHYQDVLNNPDAINHQNIRQFMKHGWSGVEFEGTALSPK